MLSVLLVEDDEDKREDLSAFIREELSSDLVQAQSFQGGKREMEDKQFDLVLLDMTMPTFDIRGIEDGGRSQTFGGKMLLHEMVRSRSSAKAVVITQFDYFGKGDETLTIDQLDDELRLQFSRFYLGIVQYNVGYEGWKGVLRKLVNHLKEE